MVRRLTRHLTQQVAPLISSSPPPPSSFHLSPVPCLTIVTGVMDTQPRFVVETGLSGVGTVG